MSYLKKLFLFSLLLISQAAFGGMFSNSYINFEVPKGWMCKPFKVTWVCHSKLARKQKEAVIVMVAKEAGHLDTLNNYQTFLRKSREVKKGKKIIQSRSVHVKQKILNGQPWVDGFHKESEVPNYFTRYIVTKCCDNSPVKLGILMTLSAQKDHYTKYANDFLQVINSLRVANLRKNFKNLKIAGKGESMGRVSQYIEEIVGGAGEEEFVDEGEEAVLFGMDSSSLTLSGLAVLIFLILLSRIIRKKKKKKKEKKPRRS